MLVRKRKSYHCSRAYQDYLDASDAKKRSLNREGFNLGHYSQEASQVLRTHRDGIRRIGDE